MVPPDWPFPLPDLLDEGLAPHLAPPRVPRLSQLALDDHLRGDAGVIEAGLPEHVEALHPLPAGERVHQRVVERVAHVERAGDVRGRQEDAEGLGTRLGVRAHGEGARLLPQRRDARLVGRGIEGLVHRHGRVPGDRGQASS
jgi:hypothetical protein